MNSLSQQQGASTSNRWKSPLSKITDKVFLSGSLEAQTKKNLDDLGISHVLVAGAGLSQKFPNDFTYHQLPIYDDNEQDLFPYFHQAIEFMENADKVLVHCAAGKSRSVSMVIAYLMKTKKLSYFSALNDVQAKRKIAQPNQNFQAQLQKLELILYYNKKNLKDFKIKKEGENTQAISEQ